MKNLRCSECGEQKPFCVCEQNMEQAHVSACQETELETSDFGKSLVQAGKARLCASGYGWCDGCGYCRRRQCR